MYSLRQVRLQPCVCSGIKQQPVVHVVSVCQKKTLLHVTVTMQIFAFTSYHDKKKTPGE